MTKPFANGTSIFADYVYEASTVRRSRQNGGRNGNETQLTAVSPRLSVNPLDSSHLRNRSGRLRTCLDALQQSVQHAFYFRHFFDQALVLLVGDESEVARQQKLIFDFACRAEGNLEESSKLALSAAAAFGQVGREWKRPARLS